MTVSESAAEYLGTAAADPPYDRDADPTYDPDAHNAACDWYPEWHGPDADAAYAQGYADASAGRGDFARRQWAADNPARAAYHRGRADALRDARLARVRRAD